LVSDLEPGIDHIRSLSEGESVGLPLVRFGHSTVAGKEADEGFAYQTEALRYEQNVIAALLRVAPRHATILRAPELPWMESVGRVHEQVLRSRIAYELAPLNWSSHHYEADLVVRTESAIVVVEIKATKNPIPVAVVDSLLAKQAAMGHPMLLVSYRGLTAAAEQRAAEAVEVFRSVKWSSADDDQALGRALNDLLGTK
jgi:hypothetical protein